MNSVDQHNVTWERRQAELWDRIFQATQDVVTLSQSFDDTTSQVVREEMVRSAMAVGTELVRANAADDGEDFRKHLKEARMKAIETDYWLRMSFVLQQEEDVQRDLSSILTQYTAIIDLLQKFSRHVHDERNVVQRHTKGPRVS